MRWRRSCKRLLIVLLFLCMTIKLHLEFRLLDSTINDNSFSPWWSNETLGHLRGQPKTKPFTKDPDLDKRADRDLAWLGNQTLKVPDFRKKVLPDASAPKDSGKRFEYKDNNSNSILGSTSNASVKIFSAPDKDSQSHSIVHREDGVKNTNTKENLSKTVPPTQNGDSVPADDGQKYSNRKLNYEKADAQKPNNENQTERRQQKEQDENSVNNNLKPTREVVKEKPNVGVRKPQVKTNAKRQAVSKKGVSHDVDSEEVSLSPEDIEKIKKQLVMINDEQKILNEDRYGPFLSNTTILLVQVHNRLENLRYLVESMNNTRGINETLVIFSHDYWYPAMNEYIANITDFRILQMFFPFSIQLHPLSYPGRDPRDCSWNVNGKDGGLKCLNREWPDTYGHYREASFTQIKHHWWWKIHRVFNGLRITQKNYTGSVIFLEEDHYIVPDLLYVFGLMQKMRQSKCPACQVLALGNYNKMSPTVYKNNVERGDWWVTKHNLGFALDVPAWKELMKCRPQFCQFDDYNWDWTLNNIIQTCFKPRMAMFSLKFSRVIHVGSCGTHVKKRNCDVSKEVQNAKNRIASGKHWLFPNVLNLQSVYRSSGRVKKGNGGWGDFRDRMLCQAIWNGTASEKTLENLQFPEFAKT